MEYEQRTDASWGVNPVGLWGLMRLLTNKHLTQLDLNNPHPVFDENGIYKLSEKLTKKNESLEINMNKNKIRYLERSYA